MMSMLGVVVRVVVVEVGVVVSLYQWYKNSLLDPTMLWHNLLVCFTVTNISNLT
jgi:predicted membrane-bound mannosyltransferase